MFIPRNLNDYPNLSSPSVFIQLLWASCCVAAILTLAPVIRDYEISKDIKNGLYFEIIEPETLRYTFKVRQARDFGVSFNETLSNVGLVVSEPADGCSALINKYELQNNVALLERGGCSFLSKCIQAQSSGVLAVVVYDNDIYNDLHYIDMIDDDTKRNCSIPAVFLLGTDGHMIKKRLKVHQLTRAIINIPVNITYVPLHQQKRSPWILW